MRRLKWAAGLMVCLAGSALLARPGVVKTNDGQTYEGDIHEKTETVRVTVKGIETELLREKIASITYPAAEGYDKEFADKLAKLDKKDVKGRLALARQAFDARRYELARGAVDEALQIDPNSTDAAALRDNIAAQMRLERAKAVAVAAGRGPATTAPAGAAARHYLSADAINTIRQMEMKKDEDNLTIRFEKGVQKRFAAAENIKLSELTSQKAIDQVNQILERGSPDMKRDVKIIRDPAALVEYRTRIQPFVLANCATSQCHGGPTAPGNFQLFNTTESDPAGMYTNFYILQNYTKTSEGGSVFAGGDLRMIDRTQPSKSLLVQYSLPQAAAEVDHPNVPGFKPAIKTQTDPRYRQMVEWIGTTLVPVEPQYNIEYKITGHPPTTKPTTQQ